MMEIRVLAESCKFGFTYLKIFNNGYTSWDSFLKDALNMLEPRCKDFIISQDKVWCQVFVDYNDGKNVAYHRFDVGRFTAFKFSLSHRVLSNCDAIGNMNFLSIVFRNVRWETPCACPYCKRRMMNQLLCK